ncbi:MAG TPA: AAA family ATPase [Bryobacteraceae bacterium]|jgi:ATP-dependent 26S proteasome regulatory subunit|nr:AAA family ATPase [Bryobacteraceae bacterium]
MALTACRSTTLNSDRPGARILQLTPAQDKAAGELRDAIAAVDVCLLSGDTGTGKTTVLRRLACELDGSYVAIGAFLPRLRTRSPFAIEESVLETLETALADNSLLLVDDLQFLSAILRRYEHPRAYLIDIVLETLIEAARQHGTKLVFSNEEEDVPPSVKAVALTTELDGFTEQDFGCICRHYLGRAADLLDFDKLFRFAPALNGHQLRNACLWLSRRNNVVTTDDFVEYLRTRNLVSNVDLEEVEPVTWSDLKGMEEVVEELEAKIALPFENEARALQLDLKPKRGVLLAGPPGTGKTTIGRALAHRLQGKFFLIDGTVNAASGTFFDEVEKVFEAAKKNAPSIIFIDDADVIFESGNHGLFRYLLTMMDGLESVSSGQVCVMITAMDTTALPPALLRSGRVELWLYTRLPNEQARAAIFRERLIELPPPVKDADVDLLARKSAGLSGADLKAVIEEGKLLYAHALVKGRPGAPVESFFLRAIQNSLRNRRSYGKRAGSGAGPSRFGFPINESGGPA